MDCVQCLLEEVVNTPPSSSHLASGIWPSMEKEGEGYICSSIIYTEERYTVEPLNNGHIGTHHFVHYREVVLFQRQKCI